MLVLSVQSQHPTPQLLCQPCCCCTTGDFSREPLVSASTGTYPDHVFDYPPGDNRVLLDQLRQVVQPSSYGRNALLNPTGREGPGQTPLPSAAGFHAHRTQSRLKGRGNTHPPPATLGGTRGPPNSGAPAGPQEHSGDSRAPVGHPRPNLWGTHSTSGASRGGSGPRDVLDPRPRDGSQQDPKLPPPGSHSLADTKHDISRQPPGGA